MWSDWVCFCVLRHHLPAGLNKAKTVCHVLLSSFCCESKRRSSWTFGRPGAACTRPCWQRGQITSPRQEYLWWKLDQHGTKSASVWGLWSSKQTKFCRKTQQKANNASSKRQIVEIKTFFSFFPSVYRNFIHDFPLSVVYRATDIYLEDFPVSPSLYAFWWQACGLQSFYSLRCSGLLP